MMKTIVLSTCFVIQIFCSITAKAQSAEVQQLLLNVEKLSQLKEILNGLYKSYEVLHNGYNAIRDLSSGNFNLHDAFLQKLIKVSPVVKKYKRVGDIVSFQLSIVKEYKQAFSRFKADKNFSLKEIQYLGSVYSNLFDESLKNIDALVTVMTADQLRMSDDERLQTIDQLFEDMEEKLVFLRHFNNNTSVMALQRAKDKNDINTIQNVYGLK